MDWKKLATFVATELNKAYMMMPHSILISLKESDDILFEDFKKTIGAEFSGEENYIISLIGKKYKSYIKNIAEINNTSISIQADLKNAENFGNAF